MNCTTGTLALVLTLFAGSAVAADRDIFTRKDAAIRGYDPVAYFALQQGERGVVGEENISHDYMGSTWHFSSEENRALFAANPSKYAPQYGGYCAFAVSHGFTKPTNPHAWAVVDDKLYLNLSKGVQKKWRKDQDAAIARADGHWPAVLSACEAKDNCEK